MASGKLALYSSCECQTLITASQALTERIEWDVEVESDYDTSIA